MREYLFRSISVLLVLLLTLSGCVSFSDESWQSFVAGCKAERWNLSNPIPENRQFFVTSRLPDCRNGNPGLTIQRADEIRFGRITAARESGTNFMFQSGNNWWSDLEASLSSNDGKLILYIHGYNNSFDEVAVRADQIASRTKFAGPIISYHWPSHESFVRYTVDETNRQWDDLYFTSILTDLINYPAVQEITIVAHSMGGRGAVRALSSLEPDPLRNNNRNPNLDKIKKLILVSSDIDRQLFEQLAQNIFLTDQHLENGRRVAVFTSRGDRAVGLSAFLHGYDRVGVTRCIDKTRPEPCYAGQAVRKNRNEVELTKLKGVKIFDTSFVKGDILGHADFLKSRAAVNELCKLLLQPAWPEQKFQVVKLEDRTDTPACPGTDRMVK